MIELANHCNPPLLVFSDDWGRHPSSCQHLIRYLLESYEVYWINTIGTRKPCLDVATLRRGLEKMRQWYRTANGRDDWPANLHVLNPRMWPWFSSMFDRKLNRELLVRQLGPVAKSLRSPPIAVTTLPIVSDLIGLLPVDRWVYYCVDDFSQWPGLDQTALRDMEARLVCRADAIIAVSETLQQKLARAGRDAHLLTHGVDLEFWQPNIESRSIPELECVPRPLVVFWGVIDRRMDLQFLDQLARDLTSGTIVLVGPQSDPDPALFRLPRLTHIPPVRYEQLPHLAREASVLIMPYADISVNYAIQPLKLKEYLATGRPAVARALPSTSRWADCLDLVDTPQSFSRAVQVRLRQGLPEHQRTARARLDAESWAEKAQAFEGWALCSLPSREKTRSRPGTDL